MLYSILDGRPKICIPTFQHHRKGTEKKNPGGQSNSVGYSSTLANTNVVPEGITGISGGANTTTSGVCVSPTRSGSSSSFIEQTQTCSHDKSGDLLKVSEIRRKLRSFYLDHGEVAQNNKMGLKSLDGCCFVSKGS